ncbi:MAG: hypothetical protein HY825_19035 [Acidobacteria bacterium]|nr:hypothetical protein [Acidobacteriota bacterium]
MNALRSAAGLAAALLCAAPICTPSAGEPTLTDPDAQDAETHAAATEAVLPHRAAGDIYVTGNRGINHSTDGGETWQRLPWLQLHQLVPGCAHIFPFPDGQFPSAGDTDVKATRAFLSAGQRGPRRPNATLNAYPVYASVLKGSTLGPISVILYHAGLDGALADSHAQCYEIPVYHDLGPEHFADKPAIALVEGQRFRPPELWVSWQWALPGALASNYLTKVSLDSATGDFLNHTPPLRLLNPGEGTGPAVVPMDWGDCTPPTSGVDHAARGNMFADVDGNVYIAYSNNVGLDSNCGAGETRRIYVRRITARAGKAQFHTCVDQIENSRDCATSAPIIEENDPSIAVDPVTGRIVLAYLTQPAGGTAAGRYRATMAWSSDGHSWSRRVVAPTDVDADQAHVALAGTTSFDPLDRATQGAYFLTWYEPKSELVPLVERRGQVFAEDLDPSTDPMSLSGDFFHRDFSTELCTGCPRGVFEYQGAAHAPGANRWIASWTAPRDPHSDNLADTEYGIWINTVP